VACCVVQVCFAHVMICPECFVHFSISKSQMIIFKMWSHCHNMDEFLIVIMQLGCLLIFINFPEHHILHSFLLVALSQTGWTNCLSIMGVF